MASQVNVAQGEDLAFVTLNNGVVMPSVGIGVFRVSDSMTTKVVETAFAAGYRSVDTAAVYQNERGVGRAVASCGIARDEVFVTSKLWNADQGFDQTLRAFDQSLANLRVDYVDLFLIHWPAPRYRLYADSWRALHAVHLQGRARAIGVSNFMHEHLREIAELGLTIPAVNQIELHPAFQQRAVEFADSELGTKTEAWSPLAHSAALLDPVIGRLARKLGRTPAQVILRWHLQQGRIVIPKSTTPERIAENIQIFDFALSREEISAVDRLGRGGRIGPDPRLLH
jgi:2,5-diketo-D-gluconate reductase A